MSAPGVAVPVQQTSMTYVPAEPATMSMPGVTYAQPQQVQYVTADGQPIDPGVQYVDQDGNPINYVTPEGMPVGSSAVQYVDENGNPIAMEGAYAPQPTVFNITPEQFALLANGGSLTQVEVDSMMGGAPLEAAAPAASSSEPKKKSSKKKLSSKKKKAKGCC